MSTNKFSSSAPIEADTKFEERIKNKIDDINRIRNFNIILEKMITHSKNENRIKLEKKNYLLE